MDTATVEQQERRSPVRRAAWLAAGVALAVIVGIVAVRWAMRQIQPMVRRRVVQSLSARFHSPVELDRLDLAMRGGVLVRGGGLRILSLTRNADPAAVRQPGAAPMLSIDSFEFSTGWRELFRPTTRIFDVKVNGLRLNIPPKELHINPNANQPSQPAWSFAVDTVECTDATVTLETSNPQKRPLVFQIRSLHLKDVGTHNPLRYEAVLVNPKPVGDVASTGTFGPWRADSPRDTPLTGDFSFTHADLASIHGIGGVLNSTGRFDGTLGMIAAQGAADVPNFRLDISDHPMPLHVDYRALVDGTTGDTHLEQIRARLAHSEFTATGSVTRSASIPGHTTELYVVMDRGRIEDSLSLALKASPPLLHGGLALRAHILIPPGPVSVTRKMRADGRFTITQANFNDQKMQQKIDAISMRAQGKPKLANAQDAEVIGFSVTGTMTMADAVIRIPDLAYQMPGGQVKMGGEVDLVPNSFEFRGTIRTQATASQMTTGWKSAMLTPFDKLLKKNGAGLELPVRLTGTHTTYDLGFDFPHTSAPPATVTGMPRGAVGMPR